MDEQGSRKRKFFSGTTKQEANKKITTYIEKFENQIADTDESKKLLRDSLQKWLEVFKFPSVEQTTYDRAECTAKMNSELAAIVFFFARRWLRKRAFLKRMLKQR